MKNDFGCILREHKVRYPLMEPQDYGKLIFQSEFGAEHMVTDKESVKAYLLEEWEGLPKESVPSAPEAIGGGLCRFPLSACPSVRAVELLAELFVLTAQRHGSGLEDDRGSHDGMDEMVFSKKSNGMETASCKASDRTKRCRTMGTTVSPEISNEMGDCNGINEQASQKEEDNEISRIHMDGITDKINQLADLEVPGMEEWMADWREKGYPAVHHSGTFNRAYHPHYRLLRKEYAAWFPGLVQMDELLAKGEPVIVSIDGRCGSGKTSFAALAARLFPCTVLHMDDFYMPFANRGEDWEEIPGGNMDFERFLSEVLLPVKAGKAVQYRPYNCRKGMLEEMSLLPFQQLTIVEGSYSGHPQLAQYYDLKIFLTCSKEEQTRRLQAREGDYFQTFVEKWIPMEERYFRQFGVEEHSDLMLEAL